MHIVLVTGGAGFIGSRVIEKLLSKEDTTVVCVDNFDPVYERAFKEENIAPYRTHERFTLYECDIRDREALSSVFAETTPTHVIHLAAKADTRDAVVSPLPYIEVNVIGSMNVFECARLHGVLTVVCASSSSVYGNHPALPWSETMHDLHPISPYGVTKLSMEHLAFTYHHNFNLPVVCLRYFNAYGENNRPGMVPYKWAEAMLTTGSVELSGNGERRRDYTHVDDIAEATVRSLEISQGFEIVNIGYGAPLSLNELLTLFENATGKKATVIHRESHGASVESTYADTKKANAVLGWKPKISHEEGIARLLAWFKEHRLT